MISTDTNCSFLRQRNARTMASAGDEEDEEEEEEPAKVIVSPQETSRCKCEYLKNSCVASLTSASRDSTAGDGWSRQPPDSATSDDVVNDKPVCEALEKSKVILKTIENNRPSHEALVKTGPSSESFRINKPICKVLQKSKSILEALEQKEESKVQVPLPRVSCGRLGGGGALPTHFRRPVCQYLLQAMENFPLFTSASFNCPATEGRDILSSGSSRSTWEHARRPNEAIVTVTATVSSDETLAKTTASVFQPGERNHRTSGAPTRSCKEWLQESNVYSVAQTTGVLSAKQIQEKLDLKQPEVSTASETQVRHTNSRNLAVGNIPEGHQRVGTQSSPLTWTEPVCQYLGQTRGFGSYTEPSGTRRQEQSGAFTSSRNTVRGDPEEKWETGPSLDALSSASLLKKKTITNLTNECVDDSLRKTTTSSGTQTEATDYSLNKFPVGSVTKAEQRTRCVRHRTCGYLDNKTGNSTPLTSIKCDYLNIQDGNCTRSTGITCEYLNTKTVSSIPSTGSTCDYLNSETGNSVCTAGITCEYLSRNSASHANLTCDYLNNNRNSPGLTTASWGPGARLGWDSGWKCDTSPQQPSLTEEDSPSTNTAPTNRLENIYRVNIDANSCVSSSNQEAIGSNGDARGHCTGERRPTLTHTKSLAVTRAISQNLTYWRNNEEQNNSWESNSLEKNVKLYGTDKVSQPLYGTNKVFQPLYGTNNVSQPLYGTNNELLDIYPVINDRFSDHFAVRKTSMATPCSGTEEQQQQSGNIPGRPSDTEGNETHSLHATLNYQQFLNTKNRNKNTSHDVRCSHKSSSGKEEMFLQSRVSEDRVLPSNTGGSSSCRWQTSADLTSKGQKYSSVIMQENKLVTKNGSESTRPRTVGHESSKVQNTELLPGRPLHRQYLTKGYSGSESSVRSGCKVVREDAGSAKCGGNSHWLESEQQPHLSLPAPAAVLLAPVPSTTVRPAPVPSTTVRPAPVPSTTVRAGKVLSSTSRDYITKIAIKDNPSHYSDAGKTYVRTTGPDTGRSRVDTGRSRVDTGRSRVDTGRSRVDTGRSRVDTGRSRVDTGRSRVDTGRSRVDTGRTRVDTGRSRVDTGRSRVDTGRSRVDTGRSRVDTGRTRVDTGRSRVDTGRSRVDSTRPTCADLQDLRDDQLSYDQTDDDQPRYNIRRNNFHDISKENDERGTEIPESVITKIETNCTSAAGGNASQDSASHRNASHVPSASSKSLSSEDEDSKPLLYTGQSYMDQRKVKGHLEVNTSYHLSKLLTEKVADKNPVCVTTQTSSVASECVSRNETPRAIPSASFRRSRVRTDDSTPTHLRIKDKGGGYGGECWRSNYVAIMERMYVSTPCGDDTGQSTDDDLSSSSETQCDTSAYCTMDHHNKENTRNLLLSGGARTTIDQQEEDQASHLLRTCFSHTSDLSYFSDLSNDSSVSCTSGLSHTSGVSKVSTLPLTNSLPRVRNLSRTSILSKTSSLSNASSLSKAGSLSKFSTLTTSSSSLSSPLSLSRASTIPALLSLSRNTSNSVASHHLSEGRYEDFSGSPGSEGSEGTLQKYDHDLVVSLTPDSNSPRENDLGLVTLTPGQDPGYTP